MFLLFAHLLIYCRLKFKIKSLKKQTWKNISLVHCCKQHSSLFIQSDVQVVISATCLATAHIVWRLREVSPLLSFACTAETFTRCALPWRVCIQLYKAAGESLLETPCKLDQWKLTCPGHPSVWTQLSITPSTCSPFKMNLLKNVFINSSTPFYCQHVLFVVGSILFLYYF